MNNIARIGSGLFFILFTVGLFGQQEEVRVVKPYTPTLSGAEKMQLLPSLNEEIEYEVPEFSYDLFQKRYDTEFKITPIVAARMIQMPLKKLYKSYLKAGMGNYLTSIYFTITKIPVIADDTAVAVGTGARVKAAAQELTIGSKGGGRGNVEVPTPADDNSLNACACCAAIIC